MATTNLDAAEEAQQRRNAATAPRSVPEVGDGQTPIPSGAVFGPGGNLLNGWFPDPSPGASTSLRVIFHCPGLTGGATLDFGDPSPPHRVGSLAESVEHEYADLPEGTPSAVYDATIRDEHGRLRGWIRFRLPHHQTLPQDMRAGHPASRVV
jgi:hypothetical protein